MSVSLIFLSSRYPPKRSWDYDDVATSQASAALHPSLRPDVIYFNPNDVTYALLASYHPLNYTYNWGIPDFVQMFVFFCFSGLSLSSFSVAKPGFPCDSTIQCVNCSACINSYCQCPEGLALVGDACVSPADGWFFYFERFLLFLMTSYNALYLC